MQAAAQAAEAAARTEALETHVDWLRALCVDIEPIAFDFDAARAQTEPPPFDAGGLDIPEPEPELDLPSSSSGLLSRVLRGHQDKRDEAVEAAREKHVQALREHAEREQRRTAMLADAMAAHERAVTEIGSRVAARNREVDALRARIESGDPAASAAMFAAVLAASDYPDDFPRRATVALDPSARLLIVDYELPRLDAMPAAQGYRYEARTDSIQEVPRPSSRRKDLYAVVVASVALRSVRELFDADRVRALDRIAFNGYVHGVDRVTEEAVRPYLVSFETTREEFRLLEIGRTDPIVSMRNVGAAFSTNPAELAPVRQVIGVRAVTGALMATSPA